MFHCIGTINFTLFFNFFFFCLSFKWRDFEEFLSFFVDFSLLSFLFYRVSGKGKKKKENDLLIWNRKVKDFHNRFFLYIYQLIFSLLSWRTISRCLGASVRNNNLLLSSQFSYWFLFHFHCISWERERERALWQKEADFRCSVICGQVLWTLKWQERNL